MSGWGNATRQGGWNTTRRANRAAGLSRTAGRWTAPDVAVMVGAFVIRWELGLAFLGLKLWQQASGYQGSVFSFAREKWDGMVALTRQLLPGTILPFTVSVGPRSTGNKAFDAWRQGELTRIEAERERLQTAEREFTAYRDELLHAKDREDFDRFMQARDPTLR